MNKRRKSSAGPIRFQSEKRVSKGEEAELTIARLAADGRGIASHQQRAVFVEDALPGEQIRVRLQRKGKVLSGDIVARHSASEARLAPDCKIYGRCGGCQFRHMSYDSELDAKRENLRYVFSRHFADAEERPSLFEQPLNYRHRARFAFVGKLIGFRESRSDRIVAVEQCPVLDERLNEVLPELFAGLGSCLSAIGKGEFELVVDDSGQIAAALCGGSDTDRRRFTATANSILSNNAFSSDLVLRHEQLQWPVQVGDFTQINRSLNRRMIAVILDELAPKAEDHIGDFFAGLGNFSLPLAAAGAAVTGFEVEQGMVDRAKAAAQLNQIGAVEFLRMDLFNPPAKQLLNRMNKAVLDPPRAGAEALSRWLVERQSDMPLSQLVYVSCNPQSLMRDLEILSVAFNLEAWQMVDMFPRTRHAEVIAFLRAQRPEA